MKQRRLPSKKPASKRLLRAARPALAATTLKAAQLLALQAFEVAIRTGSFKIAAQSLHLSPSAVSHRIRKLEQSLGVVLFVRTHRAIKATAQGRELATATGRAFAELARAGAPAVNTKGRQRLTLKVLPLFASAWLIPRLTAFMTRYPDIDLAIESSSQNVDFDTEVLDAGISMGDGNFEGLVAHRLASIRTTPIAAPALARRLKAEGALGPQKSCADSRDDISSGLAIVACARSGSDLKPARTISVDTFVAALQAAEQGAGVALGLEPLIAERERLGTICRPLLPTYSRGGYWLVHPPGGQHNRALRLFKRWLLSEAQAQWPD